MTDDDSRDEPPITRPVARRPQSVWPPFVSFLVTLSLVVFSQAVLAVWHIAAGGDPKTLVKDLPGLIATVPVFLGFAAVSQILLLAVAVVVARLFPVRPRGGLGFVRSAVPLWAYPALIVGTFAPQWVGQMAAATVALVLPPDETLERVFGNVTPWEGLAFVPFITFVPGIVEEAYFRGYVQRRRLARWPAWASILATAGVFGVFHFSPAYVAFAFVLGLWLGAVAWRAGSVWPASLCHMSANAASCLINLGPRFGWIPEELPDVATAVIAVVSLGCFGLSVRVLARCGNRPAAIAATDR